MCFFLGVLIFTLTAMLIGVIIDQIIKYLKYGD